MPPPLTSLLQAEQNNYNFLIRLDEDTVNQLRGAKAKLVVEGGVVSLKIGESTLRMLQNETPATDVYSVSSASERISVPMGRFHTRLSAQDMDRSIQKLHSENKKLAKIKEITKIGRLGTRSPSVPVSDMKEQFAPNKGDLEQIQQLAKGAKQNFKFAKNGVLDARYAKFVQEPSDFLRKVFENYEETDSFRMRILCKEVPVSEYVVSDSDGDALVPNKRRKISDISTTSSNMSHVSNSSASSFDEMSEEETPEKFVEKFERQYREYRALYERLAKQAKLDQQATKRLVKMHNDLLLLKNQLWNYK